ncbi:PLP-dependent aminotransferase family protein [Gelidibacter mesophilus]|uniref:MocR-like pyridoxine biosynthesis transcription factor PdxR n=1 Tax=Gelidibacter mesophilus TaxID=169050 RepID=UPI0004221058|nr:PLP-dependent aminotransferase family protein [Gelidibacter mesophilus]
MLKVVKVTIYCTYQFLINTYTNLHFNIKNILLNYGFKVSNSNNNIYLPLYKSLKSAIIKKGLEENLKLPPTRVLAKDLGISRSTVVKAYNLLTLEKFVDAIPGSGYYVVSLKSQNTEDNFKSHLNNGGYPKKSMIAQSFDKNLQILSTAKRGVAFRPGLPPLDVFPVQHWKKLSNDYWRTVRASELSYSSALGLECLRRNIADYLKIYRSINCSYYQIVITTGSLHSLYLIGSALIDPNDDVVMENPTYPYAYNLFDNLKASIHLSEIDEEGIEITGLRCTNPKLIYTTPSNQYPKGIKMSLKRRMELLKWASSNSSIIIEDDYDHEFSNLENPISSLFSLDKQERVFYLGTFNKLLHPSIRIGYMIVPNYLIDTIRALTEQSTRFVSPSIQNTLSNFIEKDYLNKHLRRVLEVSMDRKSFFLNYFKNIFSNDIRISPYNSGLHLIGKLPLQIKDKKFSEALLKKGIIAHPYSKYFMNNKPENGLVLGYASVNKKVIRDTIDRMNKEFENFKIG